MLVKVLSLVFVRLIYEKVADNNVIAKRGQPVLQSKV